MRRHVLICVGHHMISVELCSTSPRLSLRSTLPVFGLDDSATPTRWNMRVGDPELRAARNWHFEPPGPALAPDYASKWRFANARPEPDFRYRSNRTARVSSENSMTTWNRHGRREAV